MTTSESPAVLLLADDLGSYGDAGRGSGEEAEARFMAEVSRRIRTRLGHAVRLVALTGYGGEETARRAREAGFNAHVVKPAGPAEISAALVG